MSRTYIALDLETTGLNADHDAIIEIGAVRSQGAEVLDTFSTFVNPGRTIPLQITELTGIRDQDVADAPSLHAVLPRLRRFVGRSPIVGHNVAFDLGFLQRHVPFDNENFDTFELASVLMPHAQRYSLGALAGLLGIELVQAHRALDDARATSALFHALFHQAMDLPTRLLGEIVRLGEQAQWKAAAFFRDAMEEAVRTPPDQRARPATRAGRRETGAGKRPAGPLFAVAEQSSPLQPKAERTPLDSKQLAGFLEEGGAFAVHFPGYEHRPQQVTMLRGIAEALSQGEHLLVEAPTGVGKSLAYLIPAAYWAVQNGERVVISTNTINLQEQLYHKDLPDLVHALPEEFRAAVLKGRSHYLCPARLQAMRRRRVNSIDKARVLAKVLVWMQGTEDGDGDQVFLPSPVERGIWWQLSADNEGCQPELCRRFHAGNCFFYRARRAAESAHVVIVNHALLLADVAVQNRALPEYKYLIVDEAHHLEAATTSGLSFETDHASIRRLLLEAGQIGQNGRVTGLLAETIGRCQKARLPDQFMQQIEIFVGKVGIAMERALRHVDLFFENLNDFVQEQQQGKQSQYTLRMRVTSGLRVQPAWESVEIAWDDANAPLAATVDGLDRLAGGLDDLTDLNIPDSEDLQAQLLGVARQLREAKNQISQMITEPDSSLIYWLEADAQNKRLRLHAAPLHVGPLVEEHLFHKKESVVLTSATLRTNASFDFLRERLNAWEANELVVGSPFDYKNSTLVYLVDDIPEPGKQGYQRAVEQGMAALFRATEGRALGLFTSYNQLRTTARAIRAPLAQAGITVQAQGQGISRAQLLENFRTGERRVLLGTRSFWEGVDVPGEALSCLVIAKLPFSVPSDPVFAARSETYDQPFFEYAVPGTILRFLQGFGRLIRTRTDRGVVVVLDKRLLTKTYGPFFLDSLPDPTVHKGSLALLPKTATDWLSRQP